MKYFLFFFLGLFLSCCYSVSHKLLAKWEGTNKDFLTLKLGIPDKEICDGTGGEILFYTEHIKTDEIIRKTTRIEYVGSGTHSHRVEIPVEVVEPAQDYWNYKIFYINLDGVIYNVVYEKHQTIPDILYLRFNNICKWELRKIN